jgi:hypothetical protein
MAKKITETGIGLHLDSAIVERPKGTYRYALNAVMETDLGDISLLSNEESNEPCAYLPQGYTPLGKVYIGDNRTAIFSKSADGLLDEIGILDNACTYTTHVNGDLGFSINHQIDATYRLRRGCETTIYWVDGKNNKPMYYVFEKPQQFKDGAGDWLKTKFELQRSYRKVPKFEDVILQNSGGALPPGSYNIAVQYLDENLNPTEWIATSEVIICYGDDTTEAYLEIEGEINIAEGADVEDYRTFGDTDKSIKVVMDNLDETFLYYRLAFIGANNGSGQINEIHFTEKLPTQNNIFIYTGTNFETEGTLEEIAEFNSIIESAGSIEQADNILILGNTQGKQINYCNLQRYASRINTDLVTKKVFTNQMVDEANPKYPTARFNGVGYQPGEIYSLGVVYVFGDGTQTPVYHIPGKNPTILDSGLNNVSQDFVFAPGENVYPMSPDNESLNSVYSDNDTCSNSDYWGTDSIGDALKFSKVRHHRFPKRSELGIDFVNVETVIGGDTTFYQVSLNITGNLVTNWICDEAGVTAGTCSVVGEQVPMPTFQARVTFDVDGVTDYLIVNINPSDYIESGLTTAINITEYSDYYTTPLITITNIEESLDDGTSASIGVSSGTGDAEHGLLSYQAASGTAVFTAETKIYSTQIYGLKFSNIELPPTSVTNGEKIIGYYIVRNERTEEEKTILDTAVLTPSTINEKYIAHGLLYPEFGTLDRKISDRVFGLISPEFLFEGKKYPEFTSLKQEGRFSVIDRLKSKSRYLDITDGSSYDSSVHKSGGGKDKDGWSIKAITRDNITEFEKVYDDFNLVQDDVEDIFYLDALQSRDIEDDSFSVFNIAGDNKVGILQLKEDTSAVIDNTLPYVYLERPIADSYSTFRSLPYYKVSQNLHEFYLADGETYDPASAEATLFNGDTYITALRYLNTVWWDNRVAKRAGRTSVWDYIIGAILLVIGTILLIFGGSGALVIGAGIAIIGGSSLFVSSGIRRDALVRAYYDEYDKGLRETLLDDWINYEYIDLPCDRGGSNKCHTPEDDEIEWAADCVTDMWFESQVNISLRYGMSSRPSTFLAAPGKIESGNDFLERHYEHFDIYKQRDVSIYPFTKLDSHIMEKLITFNPEREDSKEYIGHPLGEWYKINPDYKRTNKEKVFFHLPLEYDCCSECQEDFPHRINYSQQSYQEELTDNFRVFLPNNYRDIEGETGQITDLFRIKNNIYIHTEEGLWHQPQNFQERVTGDIVSFLGTGEYFSTPPRKILDDNKASGGSRHKDATIKTKHGVFFPSENEGKVYVFDGNELKPISDLGLNSWFSENGKIQLLSDYYETTGRPYPYDSNPSNVAGVGYVAVYDSLKERYILTKQDRILADTITGDTEICVDNNGNTILIADYQATIDTYEGNGWTFLGLENCQLKFEKITYTTETITGEVTAEEPLPNDVDIHVFYDTSGSFDAAGLAQLHATVDAWVANYGASNPDWIGNVYEYDDATEQWLKYADIMESTTYFGQDLSTKNVLVVSFCNEAQGTQGDGPYHGVGPVDNPLPAVEATFTADYNNFTEITYPKYLSFIGIHYPVVFGPGTPSSDLTSSRNFVLHSLAALKGVPYTLAEVNALSENLGFDTGEWATLKASLQGANPYPNNGLENFGWLVQEDRYVSAAGSIITPAQFQEDITALLEGSNTTTVTETVVEVQVPVLNTEFVSGVVGDITKADNSWTMSFNLKKSSWTSWHSYIPNFFMHIADKFWSWKIGKKATEKVAEEQNVFWKHNKKGHYQNFYGERHPFTVEYVSMEDKLKTKITDDILLYTEARKYNSAMKQYFDQKDVTFNKAIFYNSSQCTGEVTLKVKDGPSLDDKNYLLDQVIDISAGTIIIDKNERDWSINDLRDIRVDIDQPIWDADIMSRQSEYYTDKILNVSSLDENKDWTELESLRDKYLVVRLIFDTFDDVKLILNYSIDSQTDSQR